MSFAALLGTMVALFALGSLAEHACNRDALNWTRIAYGFCYQVMEAVTYAGAIWLTFALTRDTDYYSLIDIPLVTASFTGSLVAILLFMFVGDFFLYWMHRLQHRWHILWRGHALHHSDQAVGVTSATRLHMMDVLGRHLFFTIPYPILFGIPKPEYVVLMLIPVAWAYFIHLNLNIGFGRLWWIATSPQYHRMHHSVEARHRDTNFAAFFPIWDIVFGTACAERSFPETGCEVPDARTLSDYFFYPLRAFWNPSHDRTP